MVDKLPIELNSKILSFLDYKQIYLLAINKVIDERLTEIAIKEKLPDTKLSHIKGIVRNYMHKCYLCNNILGKIYNLVMCNGCKLNLVEIYSLCESNYPIICSICSKINLKRGEIKYSKCDICESYCMKLGITIFS